MIAVIRRFYHVRNQGNISCPKGTSGASRSTQGQGVSKNGYNPKPGERTLEGYVKNNVSPHAETKLVTKSSGFNNHNGQTGGVFKMFGSNSHGGVSLHVHQLKWNMNYNTGDIYGGIHKSKIGEGLIDLPNVTDVNHLYQYLENGTYH